MPEGQKPVDQFDGSGDATHDGGASADRGNRDTGMPGPAPGSGTAKSKKHDGPDSTEAGVKGSGTPGAVPAPRPGDRSD